MFNYCSYLILRPGIRANFISSLLYFICFFFIMVLAVTFFCFVGRLASCECLPMKPNTLKAMITCKFSCHYILRQFSNNLFYSLSSLNTSGISKKDSKKSEATRLASISLSCEIVHRSHYPFRCWKACTTKLSGPVVYFDFQKMHQLLRLYSTCVCIFLYRRLSFLHLGLFCVCLCHPVDVTPAVREFRLCDGGQGPTNEHK